MEMQSRKQFLTSKQSVQVIPHRRLMDGPSRTLSSGPNTVHKRSDSGFFLSAGAVDESQERLGCYRFSSVCNNTRTLVSDS